MDKIRVLLIDDHDMVRAGLRMLLEQRDDMVVVGDVNHGNNALQLVEQLKPDVLLLDMEMPGTKGVEVAAQLQEAGADVKVLALSAHDDEEYIQGVLCHGAAGYLTKEEAIDEVVDAVRGVARGEEGWMSRRAVARMAVIVRREGCQVDFNFTDREEDVLRLLMKGGTNKEMAKQLMVTERTVRFHLTNIYDKLGVTSRSEAASWALKNNFV